MKVFFEWFDYKRISEKLNPSDQFVKFVSMSSFAWMIFIVLILTLVGTLTLVFITVKYYWGDRGAPPATGKERRKQKERELHLRAKQIEHSKRHPRNARNPSFWDNQKRS